MRYLTYSVTIAIFFLSLYVAFIDPTLIEGLAGKMALIIGLRLVVILLPLALIIDALFFASRDAKEVYQSLSAEEKQELKQTSKRFFGKAENNYQAYKSGEKGKISAIIDTFL